MSRLLRKKKTSLHLKGEKKKQFNERKSEGDPVPMN